MLAASEEAALQFSSLGLKKITVKIRYPVFLS